LNKKKCGTNFSAVNSVEARRAVTSVRAGSVVTGSPVLTSQVCPRKPDEMIPGTFVDIMVAGWTLPVVWTTTEVTLGIDALPSVSAWVGGAGLGCQVPDEIINSPLQVPNLQLSPTHLTAQVALWIVAQRVLDLKKQGCTEVYASLLWRDDHVTVVDHNLGTVLEDGITKRKTQEDEETVVASKSHA